MKKYAALIACVVLGNLLYNMLPFSAAEIVRLFWSYPALVSGLFAIAVLFAAALFVMSRSLNKVHDRAFDMADAVHHLVVKINRGELRRHLRRRKK